MKGCGKEAQPQGKVKARKVIDSSDEDMFEVETLTERGQCEGRAAPCLCVQCPLVGNEMAGVIARGNQNVGVIARDGAGAPATLGMITAPVTVERPTTNPTDQCDMPMGQPAKRSAAVT